MSKTMKPLNPFYHNCRHLKFIYPKTSNINAYTVVAWCQKFRINVYKLKTVSGDQKIMGCVTNSPYIQESTCNGFEAVLKHKQSKLSDYKE